jgi:hypothetical protein
MERVSAALHKHPGLSRRAIREAVKGKAATVDLARELLISEGFIAVRQDGQADRHYPVKPFQDTPETPTVSPVSQPCPDRVPDTVRETVSHRVPPPVGGDTGTRTRHGGASDKPTVSRQDANGQAHVDRAIDLLDAKEET